MDCLILKNEFKKSFNSVTMFLYILFIISKMQDKA